MGKKPERGRDRDLAVGLALQEADRKRQVQGRAQHSVAPPIGQKRAADRQRRAMLGRQRDLPAGREARAPLGPTATLALTHAILNLEDELARPNGPRG